MNRTLQPPRAVWATDDETKVRPPPTRPAVPAGEDEEAAALLEATPLDVFAAAVPNFAFLNEERVPRYRLALERAVLAHKAASVHAAASPRAAASSRSDKQDCGAASSSGRSGLAIDRVLAHMAGNRGTGPSSGVVRRKNLRGARRGSDADDSDEAGVGGAAAAAGSSFVSATAQYARDIRDGKVKGVTEPPSAPRGGGPRGRGFVPPARAGEEPASQRQRRSSDKDASSGRAGPVREDSLAALPPEEMPEQLRNLEPRMIEMIENEIMDSGATTVKFEDIGEPACVRALVPGTRRKHLLRKVAGCRQCKAAPACFTSRLPSVCSFPLSRAQARKARRCGVRHLAHAAARHLHGTALAAQG